jgi:hypothetical protein
MVLLSSILASRVATASGQFGRISTAKTSPRLGPLRTGKADILQLSILLANRTLRFAMAHPAYMVHRHGLLWLQRHASLPMPSRGQLLQITCHTLLLLVQSMTGIANCCHPLLRMQQTILRINMEVPLILSVRKFTSQGNALRL